MDTGSIEMPKSVSELPESQVTPAPSLEKRSRRQFSPEYKLRIIAEADACKHGELGALLRREKLYSNQLSAWRREYAEAGIAGLSKSAPGPAASKTPEQRENEQLRRQNDRLTRKLEMANDCLDLQKKALSMIDRLRNGNDA
jgi:transposase-like protein